MELPSSVREVRGSESRASMGARESIVGCACDCVVDCAIVVGWVSAGGVGACAGEAGEAMMSGITAQ